VIRDELSSNESVTVYKETMKRKPTLLSSSRRSDHCPFGKSVTCGDAPTEDDARIASGSSKAGGERGIDACNCRHLLVEECGSAV